MLKYIEAIYKYGYKGLKESVKLMIKKVDYMKFKTTSEIIIYLPKFKQPIFLRKHTSDQSTFRQIFEALEYAIDFNVSPKVIIDAGANIGLAAVYFSQRFPKAKIYSIEPEDSNIEIFKRNTKAYKNVLCYKKALHHTAEMSLKVIDEGIGKWGFTTKQLDAVSENKKVVSEIDTISIESLMKANNIDIIDILKIDIEGAEKPLFELNYQSWLPKTRYVIVELHDKWYPGCKEAVLNAINNYNFSSFKKGENWIFVNNDMINHA